ncbi:hypothetical protein GCM10007884_42560 [Methylobacterium brachythecii]|uniref:Uncharacterized protein n=1 Tax=Methylobacterium brachythecii TaxID=1176177 RepID=A0ABQ6D8I3_9HYPH|nr:hypothetical protein GCM10007884_42560 [Methylobacterium brachythecii]
MTNRALPGAAPGDQSLYAGRALLGFLRPSVGGIHVYAADGKPLGSFSSRKAAMAALTASVAIGEGDDGD